MRDSPVSLSTRVSSGPFTSIQKVSDTPIHSNAQFPEDGKYLAFFYNESLLQTYEKVNGAYSLLQQISGSSYSLLSMSPNSSYIPVSETVSTDLKIYKKSEKTFALFRTLSIAFFIWRLTITDTYLLPTELSQASWCMRTEMRLMPRYIKSLLSNPEL